MTEQPTIDSMVPDHLRERSHRILLDSLEVEADIGFHEFEIGKPQRLLVSVELLLDEKSFPLDDDPENAWDYDFLRREVIRIATAQRWNLQETLARKLYRRFASMAGVRGLRVSTAKPDIYDDAKKVGVEISSLR